MSELNLSEDSDQEYQVEKILERRVVRGKQVEYLIKWAGFSDAHNSWEPAKNVGTVAIQLYEKRVKEDEERRKQSKPEAGQRKSLWKNRSQAKGTPKSNAAKGTPKSNEAKGTPKSNAAKGNPKSNEAKGTPKSNEETPRSAYQDREPEAIQHVTDASGQLKLLMKFRGAEEPELVPADEANILWPQMVIAFYEERISFDCNADDPTPQ